MSKVCVGVEGVGGPGMELLDHGKQEKAEREREKQD